MSSAEFVDSKGATHAYLVCFAFFLLSLVLIGISPLNLAPDEAHYWEWSRRLDLAYYSKGPLIAYAIRASCWLLGESEFAVRFPAALFHLLFSLTFVSTVQRFVSARWSLLLTVALLSSPVFFYQRLIMTTDPLVSAFWMFSTLGLIVLWAHPSAVRALLVGLAVGGAILSKYTAAVLLASIPGPWFAERRERRPTTAIVLCLVAIVSALIPVVLWNSEHQWVNLSHNAQHLTSNARSFRPTKFFELLLGQLFFAGPWLFFFALYSLYQSAKNLRLSNAIATLGRSIEVWIALPGIVLVLVCVVTSFTRTVYANWPMPCYISGTICGALLLARNRTLPHLLGRYFRHGVVFSLTQCAVATLLFMGVTFGIAPDLLQTKKLIGWSFVGAEIDRQNPQLLPVVTENYDAASEIAFYSKTVPRVYSAVTDDRRMNQYDIWGGWEELRGRDILIVAKNPETGTKLAPHFKSLVPLEDISVVWKGVSIRSFKVWRGREYDGFVPPQPLRR